MKETNSYWTGIADVSSEEFPAGIKGAVYRVLTYAQSHEAFIHKVREVLANSGDTLILIEEPEPLTAFLEHEWVDDDHEIHEMFETAGKNTVDVVCGEIEYYSFDDA